MSKAGCFGLLVVLGVAPAVYARPPLRPSAPAAPSQPATAAPTSQPAAPAPPAATSQPAAAPQPAATPRPAAPLTIEAREVMGRQLFAAGRYAESLDVYVKLYGESPHPTYIRNIGRCYQNMGEPEKAIASFREYLRQVRDLPADQRALVDDYIAEMEGELRRRREAQAVPATSAPATTNGAAGASLTPAGPQAAISTTPEPARPTRTRRVAALVVAGASVAALAAGGFFGVRAMAKDRDADRACPMDQCTQAGVQLGKEAISAARVADVALGVGLVGAGIATYLFITSREKRTDPGTAVARRLQLEPRLGPGLAGLAIGGRW